MENPKCRCGKADATRRLVNEPNSEIFFYLCSDDNCKIKLEAELAELEYRKKYLQGKSLKSHAASLQITMYTIALGFLTLAIIGIYSMIEKFFF